MAKKKAKKPTRAPSRVRSRPSKTVKTPKKKATPKRKKKTQPSVKKQVKKKTARNAPARPGHRVAPSPIVRNSKPERPIEIPPMVPIGEIPSGLSKRDIGELRDALIRKRHEILGDVATMRDEALSRNRQDAAGDLSNMPLHPADVGSDHYEQEFTLGLIESERQIVREIDEALVRIQKGTFGICAATGQPIGLARLRVMPWAKHCYEYVLAQERGLWPRR